MEQEIITIYCLIDEILKSLKVKDKKLSNISNAEVLTISVETAFSVITSNFGKVIKASSFNGFLTKLKLFILAYALDSKSKLAI